MSMADQKPRAQRTQPKKGKPIEIPVPSKAQIDAVLDRAAKPERKP